MAALQIRALMISSALYSLELDRKMVGVMFRPLVDLLLRPLGPNHCRNSYEWQQNIYKAGMSI